MVKLTKVTRNFQITIPEEVRQEMKIKVGDKVAIEKADFGFRLHKLEKAKLEDFIDSVKFEETIPGTELQKRWRKDFERREKKLGLAQ